MPRTRKNNRAWSKDDKVLLKSTRKQEHQFVKIAKEMKRTIGALRQQAFTLGIGLGHQR